MKSGSTMGGMTGMKQMSPAESALVDSVQSHLSAQSTMTAAQLASSMSAHRALVKSLLVQMDSDRKAMTAPPDSAWIATEDSVKADLNKLATLPRAQLKAAVASDSARISRLIEMRKSMMGKPAP
jgi:signal transduction protein with GAF and PtsI domain